MTAQGVHVGEIELHGPAVGLAKRVAERIAARARAGDILASRLVADLAAASGLHFADAGRVAVDELDEPLPLVSVASEQHLEPLARKVRALEPAALTARESEVVALIASGSSNAAIAARLGISEHTVRRHVANTLLKLDLPSRTAVAAFAARNAGSEEP